MPGSIATTLDNIENRWAGADTQALCPMFALLARGQPLAPAEISSQLELAPDRVDAALQFPRIGIDDSGHLVELFGLMLRPTWHRVDVEGRAMFSCCALVTHAIPVLTGKPVRVTSVDPSGRGRDSGDPRRNLVRPAGRDLRNATGFGRALAGS